MGAAASVNSPIKHVDSSNESSSAVSDTSTATVLWGLPAKLIYGEHRPEREDFQDSVFIKRLLQQNESNDLFVSLQSFARLKLSGSKGSSKSDAAPNDTNVSVIKYFGCRRPLDKALAFDRWGSNYESWGQVEECPSVLQELRLKLLLSQGLPATSLNVLTVSYYLNGADAYEAAHRVTTTALLHGTSVYHLFLGAPRDFVICSNADSGICDKANMLVHKEWRVQGGDLFILGPTTNNVCYHAIPREPIQKLLHICVTLRTVDKNFVDYAVPAKRVTYADGMVKSFAAECITTARLDDTGCREHLADLINSREMRVRKGRQKAVCVEEAGSGAVAKAAQQAVMITTRPTL